MRSSVNALLEYIRDSIAPDRLDPADLIHEVGSASLALLPKRPTAVRDLAYKKLHVYPFKDVPISWRRVYEEACIWEILQGLEWAVEADKGLSEPIPVSPSGIHAVNRNDKSDARLERWIDDAVQHCDRAIIFAGAPARRKLIDEVLEWIDLEQNHDLLNSTNIRSEIKTDFKLDPDLIRPNKRQRVSDDVRKLPRYSYSFDEGMTTISMPTSFPNPSRKAVPFVKPDCEIPRVECPSMVQFEKHIHEITKPLIMTNTIDHWPASKYWKVPAYWDRHTLGGRRLVPVELGSSYTDESWGQTIMPFRRFMSDHLLQDDLLAAAGSLDQNITSANPEDAKVYLNSGNGDRIYDRNGSLSQSPIGYLAQHDLLNQIPALRSDIVIPDYCYVDTPESKASQKGRDGSSDYPQGGRDETAIPSSTLEDKDWVNTPEPMLNIWLGPASTVSPAHTDPHHNILAQVFGRKYVRLFAPSQVDKMYPMSRGHGERTDESENEKHGIDMGNTSEVDIGAFITLDYGNLDDDETVKSAELSTLEEERQKFPDHESATFVEAILEAGECLYIPRGWWHYVRSLEPSCNVSFWWD